MIKQYQLKYFNCAFLTILIIHLQAASPVKNAAIKPMINGSREVSASMLSAYKILLAMLPTISGTTIKKEKRAAFSLSIPNRTAVAMVAPLLEIPGNMATAWSNPMIKALFALMSFKVDFARSAKPSKTPVKRSMAPTSKIFWSKSWVIKSSKKSPTITAGIIEMIMCKEK